MPKTFLCTKIQQFMMVQESSGCTWYTGTILVLVIWSLKSATAKSTALALQTKVRSLILNDIGNPSLTILCWLSQEIFAYCLRREHKVCKKAEERPERYAWPCGSFYVRKILKELRKTSRTVNNFYLWSRAHLEVSSTMDGAVHISFIFKDVKKAKPTFSSAKPR